MIRRPSQSYRDRHRRQQACEDSGIEDTSSGALETSAVSPPSSLQPLPAKTVLHFRLGQLAGALIAQLTSRPGGSPGCQTVKRRSTK
uniref:Uncharacterized protein n=1 Tax=Macrostomum lignano TaxID=282301 RepID=A0A1I8FQD8_9PLAT